MSPAKDIIEAHREEITKAVENKETVIAYFTTENGKGFLNVLDYKGDGGEFHKFPVNEECVKRLNCEAGEMLWLGTSKPRTW